MSQRLIELDKGKPLERVGRKTTGLNFKQLKNGRRVAGLNILIFFG
jgi:hypothetical protein